MARTLLLLFQPELAGGIAEARTRSFRALVEQMSAETGEITTREWYFMSFDKARRIYRTLAKELMVSRETAQYRISLNRALSPKWEENLFFAAEDRTKSVPA